MQLWRSLGTGGRFRWQAYRHLEGAIARGEPLPDPEGYALSLVPTQLQRLLPQGTDWLRCCRVIFLGGAPAWSTLLSRARELALPLAPCYGMSETAAMVTLLAPQAFRVGAEGVGPPLPHVVLTLEPEGALALRSPSLALGYWEAPGQLVPLTGEGQPFRPDDRGEWTPAGLRLLGRASDKILSGGENVWAGEVEAQIRATGLVADVAVLGVPDADWGQRVAAAVVLQPGTDLPTLEAALRSRLAPYKRPKQWLCLPSLPRNSQGKVNRPPLLAQLQT
jgi:O-succinylbenzoic acid--CoA ligase